MYIVGINCLGPNTSACLLDDGRLVAMAEQERFSRIKTAPHAMPVGSIRYCLEAAGISLGDVTAIALGWDLDLFPDAYRKGAIERFPAMTRRDHLVTDQNCLLYDPHRVRDELRFALRASGVDEPVPEIIGVPHHRCHAASTFFASDLDEALIVAVDASGELNATTLWHGSGNEIRPLQNWDIPQSLGWFYASITEFLGFRAYSGEGKVMGLAPYGQGDEEIREKLHKFLWVTASGYEMDPTFIYFGPHAHRARFTDKLVELLGDPHNPRNPEYTPRELNVAYEAQRLLEEAVAQVARVGFSEVETRNLTVSGGVAMNCKMNGALARLPEVDRFFVFPGANDAGVGFGAALCVYQQMGGDPRSSGFRDAYLGPEFKNGEIRSLLDELQVSYEEPASIEDATADLLADGKFVGWHQGRMEFGARALGNRSILADPSRLDAKDRLNAQVKRREAFRPFCPSMLREEAEHWVKDVTDAAYMMVAFEAKPQMAQRAPAVVHVDGTIRPQLVDGPENPRYRSLIEALRDRTGLPIVLNTSFNVRGEPIVCTPLDSVRCYFSTGLDALALGDFLLTKRSE